MATRGRWGQAAPWAAVSAHDVGGDGNPFRFPSRRALWATGNGDGHGNGPAGMLACRLARVSGLSDFFHIQWRSSATLTGTSELLT